MFSFIFRKQEFVDWSSYKSKVDFLDTYWFQQDVRRQNLRNI